ncbi:MAG: phosphatase PAP2 family protein [Clostridia bacterium]|nr:phosphatase PAP2 family protein [Clostridia bacterium]
MFSGEINFLQALEQVRTHFLDTLMEGITFFGEDTILIVLVAVMYFMIHKENAYRLCFLTLCSLGLNGILKNFCKIPRPFHTGKVSCVRPETATGYSFPSGHTQNFTTWSTALSRILKKRWFTVTALVGSVIIGFSRLYLGAHYPSDVLVGLILGIAVGFLGSALYERMAQPRKLFFPVFLGMAGFGVLFLIQPDVHFADYFKCVGLMGGVAVSSALDMRYGKMTYEASFPKKLLRVIIAVVLALIFKAGLKLIDFPHHLHLSLLWDMVRHFVLITAVFGIYPLLIPKIKL